LRQIKARDEQKAESFMREVSVSRRVPMEWARVEGNWKQMKGRAKERWGRLTDDDLTAIAGRRDQLEGMIQERYGYAKERARREIEDWYRSMESNLAEQIESLRSGIQNFSSTVDRIAKEQFPRARTRTTEVLDEAEEAVKRNPISALVVALGLGFLIGVLTRR
jgi:uncharacterized protein YjbJ (UPF0337 family)